MNSPDNAKQKVVSVFGMTVEFWTTIVFEAWLLIIALLLADNRPGNYGSSFFFDLTRVKKLRSFIFEFSKF